jgi:hypothetical protein
LSGGGLVIGERVKCQICGHVKLLNPGEFIPIIKGKKTEIEEETK